MVTHDKLTWTPEKLSNSETCKYNNLKKQISKIETQNFCYKSIVAAAPYGESSAILTVVNCLKITPH